MKIDETTLTKGKARKLNALRKSVGDALGEEVFGKWLAQQVSAPKVDPVAAMIEEALADFDSDRKFNFNAEKYLMPSACLGLA